MSSHNAVDIRDGVSKIMKSIDKFQQHGSGWIVVVCFILFYFCTWKLFLISRTRCLFLQGVKRMIIMHTKFNPQRGGSYIPVPKKLAAKNAISMYITYIFKIISISLILFSVNVKNDHDNECLKWALLAWRMRDHSTTQKDPQRLSKYRDNQDLIEMPSGSSALIYVKYWHINHCSTDIKYPTPLSEIPKVAKLNKLNIFVYGYADDVVQPLELVFLDRAYETVHLMFLTTDEKQHYCYIKKLSGLLSLEKDHNQYQYCDWFVIDQ